MYPNHQCHASQNRPFGRNTYLFVYTYDLLCMRFITVIHLLLHIYGHVYMIFLHWLSLFTLSVVFLFAIHSN